MSDGLLLDEIGAWTSKYERLRSLVAAELGLPDADAIAAAEARGYDLAVANLRDDVELLLVGAATMADLSWSGKQVTAYHAAYLLKHTLAALADRLAAPKETTDHA